MNHYVFLPTVSHFIAIAMFILTKIHNFPGLYPLSPKPFLLHPNQLFRIFHNVLWQWNHDATDVSITLFAQGIYSYLLPFVFCVCSEELRHSGRELFFMARWFPGDSGGCGGRSAEYKVNIGSARQQQPRNTGAQRESWEKVNMSQRFNATLS